MLHSTTISRSVAALALGLFASFGPGQDPKAGQDPKGAPPAAKPHEMPRGPRAWLVELELGPKFDPKVPMTSQPGFEEHAKRVHAMADDGTLLLGGPLFDAADAEKITGAALIVRAKDEKELREKLGSDPYLNGGVMKIASVRAMMVGVGAWMPKEKEAGTAR